MRVIDIRSQHIVETPEHIVLKVSLAGLADRVFAALVDGVLMGVLLGVSLVFFSLPAFTRLLPELGKTVVPLASFLILFGYHLFQEWLWDGKTLGKAIFGIRVVRTNGQPIGFWEAFGRNLLRVVDVYLSGIGLACMMLNRDEKRLGDFLAGTIVISDQPIAKPLRLASMETGATEPGMATAQPVLPMSDEEADLLKVFLSRRLSLFKDARRELSDALARYFTRRLGEPVESEAALDNLLTRYRNPGR